MPVPFSEIQELCDEIVEKFQPEKVILFGSYASGTPTEDSDVDLMIVMDHFGRPIEKAVEIRIATKHKFPLDLLVRDRSTIKQRVEWNDWFLRDIVENGQILYESAHS